MSTHEASSDLCAHSWCVRARLVVRAGLVLGLSLSVNNRPLTLAYVIYPIFNGSWVRQPIAGTHLFILVWGFKGLVCVCGRVPVAAPGSVKAACKAYLWPLWLESWQNPPLAFAPGGVSSTAVERCGLIEIQI